MSEKIMGDGNGPEAQHAQHGRILQGARRDCTELVPTGRPRAQSMRGCDPIYTDIVDYIVRCTHDV